MKFYAIETVERHYFPLSDNYGELEIRHSFPSKQSRDMYVNSHPEKLIRPATYKDYHKAGYWTFKNKTYEFH